jgi:hypothetical protein
MEAWLNLSWNDIVGAIAPTMIIEATDGEVRRAIQHMFLVSAKEHFSEEEDLRGKPLLNFQFSSDQYQTVVVQFLAR